MRRIYLAVLLAILLAITYVQVMVLYTFNDVVAQNDHMKIELRPRSEQDFGGLSWGLLRFDSKDQLSLGILADIGVGKEAKISFKKDDKIYEVMCRADDAGICRGTIRQPDMAMLGTFTWSVRVDKSAFTFEGRFKRRSKPMFFLREVLLSV